MTEISAVSLHLDRVFLGMRARGLYDAFESIARHAADEARVPFFPALTALRERESTLSTAWGGGVAVPHARVAGLSRSYIAFARLLSPIEFGAPDGCPVDLLLVVLSPLEQPAEHVRLLARLARRLREPSIVARLRSAADETEVRRLLE